MMKEYCGNKSLSTPKQNACIEKIDEIDAVNDSYDEKPFEIQLIKGVHVIAIERLDTYYSCVKW